MPNHATDQHLNELAELALSDESEHLDSPERWELDDFRDLLE